MLFVRRVLLKMVSHFFRANDPRMDVTVMLISPGYFDFICAISVQTEGNKSMSYLCQGF